jgi:septum formation protein
VPEQLLLASQSPRRSLLLRQLGLQHAVVPPHDVDERPGREETADAYVLRVARSKAAAVRAEHASGVLLAADTTVVLGGRILGKPVDRADACAMLRALSGRSHQVLTAVCVLGRHHQTLISRTLVRFREIGAQEIEAYWRTGEPADKAGAYAIQGLGAVFVSRLEGSYSGVMGLPLCETAQLLRAEGLDPLRMPADRVHLQP